jgi:hypothetical protein
VDPKRISIKTMKTVESIEARLGRIESALGIGGPVGQSEPLQPQQQMTEAEAIRLTKELTPEPPGKGKHRG